MSCAASSGAQIPPNALWKGCQVPGEMTGSSVFKRHHEAKSNGTIIFCRKRSGRHGQLELPECCPGRWLTEFLGPHPSASQPTGLSLDRFDVICWVQANLSIVQASLAPALLILVLYLGQLIPCKTKTEGSW